MTIETIVIIAGAYIAGTVSPAVGRKLKVIFGQAESDVKNDISVVVKKL
jgi:hypothetical protein